MRLSAVRTILRKELTDTLRDRRTLFAMVVMPILLYPLLFLVLGGIASSDRSRLEAQRPVIEVWGAVPSEAVSRLESELDARIRRRSSVPADAESRARRLLDDERAHLVVAAAPNGEDVELDVYHSDVEELSRLTSEEASTVLEDVANELLRERLGGRDLPLQVRDRDVSSEEERGGQVASFFVPMALLLMVTTGALFPAIDVTAGEKERGTMQTLLVAPVRPVELICGKYLAVVAVAVTSAVLNLGALSLALGRQVAGLAAAEGSSASFSLGLDDYATVFALLLPVALLVSAVLLVVCVFARSFREAQNYSNPVILVAMLAGFTAFSQADLTATTAFVPMVNVAMASRDVLRGEASGLVGAVFAANLLYALAAVIAAARVFESEQVLLGGERPWRDLRARRLGGSVPTGRVAVLFAIALVVVGYYGSLALGGLDALPALAIFQVGLLLVPALLFTIAGRFSLRQTLALRAPPGRALPGLLLVCAGAWSLGYLVVLVERWLFPGIEEQARRVGELVVDPSIGLAAAVGLFAVVPAVAEEACFRGVLFQGLRSTATRVGAVAASALLFGLFHVQPVRIVPSALLGVVLALVVLHTGSLFASIAVHAAVNGVVVAASRTPDLARFLGRGPVLAASALALVVGLILVARMGRSATR